MNKLARGYSGRFFSREAGCGAVQRQAAHAATVVMLMDVRSATSHQHTSSHTHTSRRLEGVPQYFPLKFKPVVGSKKWHCPDCRSVFRCCS
jgi:hypothetical protein